MMSCIVCIDSIVPAVHWLIVNSGVLTIRGPLDF